VPLTFKHRALRPKPNVNVFSNCLNCLTVYLKVITALNSHLIDNSG